MNCLSLSMADNHYREPALLTFLFTVSGTNLLGIGSTFFFGGGHQMAGSVAGIFSVEAKKDTTGLEYNPGAVHGKCRMPLSEKMSAELDFGLAYESMGDNYLVSHEFYVGYMGESGLEPYLMLKDMENEASYDVILGFYYRFD